MNVPKDDLYRSHEYKELAILLNKNRIDLWAYNFNSAIHLFQSQGVSGEQFEGVFDFEYNDNYLAIHKDTQEDKIQLLQKSIDSFKQTEKHKKLLEKYNWLH